MPRSIIESEMQILIKEIATYAERLTTLQAGVPLRDSYADLLQTRQTVERTELLNGFKAKGLKPN